LGGDPQMVAGSLRKCAELSPNFAEAHYALGQMARNSKRYEESADHFERAATAYPDVGVYWYSLAVALHQLQQTEAARRAAYKAYFAAATQQETATVMAILNLVDNRQVQVASTDADVSSAGTVAAKRGDTRLDGTLIRVDCIGEAARFHVLTGERRVLLYSLRPQEIALKNSGAGTREFECGPQKKLSVSVEYNARPDASLLSAGDVVAIEFKAN
jgi:tetratricopeptide (TPR) repeat protein